MIKERYEIKLFGIVQGVGFRPYIYNKAIKFNINGFVNNQGSNILMDIEGERTAIKKFLLQVIKKPPSLAVIEKVKVIKKQCINYQKFSIEESIEGNNEIKFIPYDVGVCDDCIKEVFSISNKRYNYAFTNCTNCGPRYSIIKKMPYDRINTKMDIFKMCQNCEKEYTDKTNRRFHAQTNCCRECGPTLKLLSKSGEAIVCDNPIKKVMEFIKDGKIAAIKGIGGFHLVCDAQNEKAVEVLRLRKNRPHKPFAIMVKDIEAANALAVISPKEAELLLSNKKPIVLLRKKENTPLAHNIAQNVRTLGIMLPYTPLHYLLLESGISCLVMTSGNLSSTPIQYDNERAVNSLGNIADYFLTHNREIYTPVEDSVVKAVNEDEVVIRRGRGYSPYSFDIKTEHKILALGAEQKNTFCLSQNGYVYMSQYLGDLQDYDAYVNYEKAIAKLKSLLEIEPEIIVHDLYESFLSSQYAELQAGRKIAIQHHHAHMAGCMAENNLFCPVIGVIFDGTGLGSDGCIWGGEFFVGTREKYVRAGQVKYVTIQGGDQAVREPWRVAVSYLYSMGCNADDIFIRSGIDKNTIDNVRQALDMKLNCYESSSMGRLFDCVSALLSIRQKITYDAQAAIELENIADTSNEDYYEFYIEEQNHVYQICYETIISGVLKDIEDKVNAAIISAKFHNTIVNASAKLIAIISEKYGIKNVVLSGGVFENNYLLMHMIKELEDRSFNVYFNHQVPTNDSGISIGQLAIAEAMEGDI